ncbi:MAG TPA: electron transfer flavoprotein subunit alpha/FixB family protein [Elusimicrobiota bacterium]|nr:electron transfer flavoprotein subunit alpha/FixB family protein [Elusimicrobiota bacterium]
MPGEKNVLIVALPQRGKLPPAVYELVSAGKAAAAATGGALSAVVFGAKAPEFAQDLGARGVEKVHAVSDAVFDQFVGEAYASAVAALSKQEGVGVVLIAASVAGRSLAARLAVLLKAGVAAEICELSGSGGNLSAKRYQSGGNIVAELAFKSDVKILTVQPMTFEAAAAQAGKTAQVVPFAAPAASARTEVASFKADEGGEIDLGAAERIVSGGRGLGNAEGFKLIRELAQTLGAAVGASRAVVDAGWIPYKHQVGLTGRTVHPKLYVACGISGQIQHLAGMASSANIVAVNTDAACPMMEIATLGVVGDVYEVLPVVISEIKRRRGAA